MENEKVIKPIFSEKAYSVPINMRPLWRISLIVISIFSVSGKKKYLSRDKLNILVWMLIRKNKWEYYEDYLRDRELSTPNISADSITFKAIEYAICKGFCKADENRVYLLGKGDELVGPELQIRH
ncbi:hypothetical protein [Grimontia marina]|uniref:Uncharacterized protein n=1 Tax=Grimontia marina TaxID=646534 RepID=A0A128FLN6_9GAMM|nr:hypothetical protein [Grimontia marina]CZF87136.1 hypothetical protein GMA8713_05187 [Grimontia marina]